MQENFNIPEDFDDWEKYAPNLARIARQNPFGVPEGYFEESDSFITGHIRLLDEKRESGFIVPPAYFDELPGRIEDRIFVLDLDRKDIPEHYFEELPDIIQSRIFLESLGKENTFAVPGNYFEELPGKIQSLIAVESLEKQGRFEVPEGYFESLPAAIAQRIAAEKKQPKVFTLLQHNWRYMAAAASVALVIGFAVFFNRGTEAPVGAQGSAVALRTVLPTREDIKQYLLENVSESALVEYAAANNTLPKNEVKTEQIEKKDVVNYLLENNVDVSEL